MISKKTQKNYVCFGISILSLIFLTQFALADWQNTPFLRGDVDQTGHPFITQNDAYFILNYLFNGGPKPKCMDSADFNDDGRVDISDAIGILNAVNYRRIGDLFVVTPDFTNDNLDCKEYNSA